MLGLLVLLLVGGAVQAGSLRPAAVWRAVQLKLRAWAALFGAALAAVLFPPLTVPAYIVIDAAAGAIAAPRAANELTPKSA